MAPSLTKNSIADAIGLLDGQLPELPVAVSGDNFLANGHPFLTHVPLNIICTPSPYLSTPSKATASPAGCFVGFDADSPASRHAMPLGKLMGIRFMSIFRFKVWWTTHWVGCRGRDIEHETQLLLLDQSESGRPYVLLLPIVEGSFRASLQPGADDYIDLCVESGSTKVCGSRFRSCLYIHVGDDPYALVREAVKVVRTHLGTFQLLEEKTLPKMVDKFGWCTWDAFYLKVHPKGIQEGVRALVEGGCPPAMVLIDDGWQSISHANDSPNGQEGMNRTSAGAQMPSRLVRFSENYKFREYESRTAGRGKGMSAFIRDLKDEFKSVEGGDGGDAGGEGGGAEVVGGTAEDDEGLGGG